MQAGATISRADLMSEILAGTAEEIRYLKNRPVTMRVADAIRVKPSANGAVFTLRLSGEAPASVGVDASIAVSLAGRKVRGTVINVDGPRLEVDLCADILPSTLCGALIETEATFLVEALKSCLETVRTGGPFLPDVACFGGASSSEEWPGPAEESVVSGILPGGLNESQHSAVRTALGRRFFMVWGPPGTGKTSTLGKLVECLVRNGRKVLVVSHSNVAVDEAAGRSASLLAGAEAYETFRVLRLGNPAKPDLFKEHPKLAFEQASEREEQMLREALAGIESRLATLSKALALHDQRAETRSLIARNHSAAADLLRDEGRITKDLAKREADLEKAVSAVECWNKWERGLGWLPIVGRWVKEKAAKCRAKRRRLEQEVALQRAKLARIQQDKADLEERMVAFSLKLNALQREIDALCPGASADALAREKAALDAEAKELRNRSARPSKEALNNALALFCTLSRCAVDPLLKEKVGWFDVCVIDEGSMASLAWVYWAACLAKESLVVFGDFLQLRPVHRKQWSPGDPQLSLAGKWFARNVYDLLGLSAESPRKARLRPDVGLLDTQNRMHPEISAIVNRHIYEGCLKDGDKTKGLSIVHSDLPNWPVVVLDTEQVEGCAATRPGASSQDEDASEASEDGKRGAGGWRNAKHQEVVIELVRRIKREHGDSLNIGVVAPYRAQAVDLQRRLHQEGFGDVLAATVHKFQGGEKDIIIFDTVASGPKPSGFMIDDGAKDDARILLNVALTRAKRQVWIVADARFLATKLRGRLITKVVSDLLDQHRRIDARCLLQNSARSSCCAP